VIPKPSYVGKVRDVYDLGDSLILVSSDRISAFDVVFDQLIPNKGKILTNISNLWFHYFSYIPNQIIQTKSSLFPEPFSKEKDFEGRAVQVKKCKRIDYECVVRGFVSGSAWKEYKSSNTIAFEKIPKGLKESEILSEPLFTPARKNDQGHDENISEKTMKNEVGSELFHKLKNSSLEIYTKASAKVKTVDLILCDTKFEFGLSEKEEVILIDELLTPDSSRYWEKSEYKIGISPPSMDKQILRNYLETLDWDKNPPAPSIPESVIHSLLNKYKELEEKIKKCT
jgi:phosphoribosylaminoimidazole-succinocarboxamide synthase